MIVDTHSENGAYLPTGKRLAAVINIVDKPEVSKSPVVEMCPSCALMVADGPHGTSHECIQALEAEIRRLSECRVSREDFLRLHDRLEETIAAVERLQQDYAIQVQRTAALQAAIDRLVQHVQALTAALGKPHEIE